MRQKLVHEEMPPLEDLRDAIHFFREWLWEMNWRHSMAISACDPTVPTCSAPVRKEIPNLQKLFAQFWLYSSKKTSDVREQQILTTKAKAIVGRIEQLIADNLQ